MSRPIPEINTAEDLRQHHTTLRAALAHHEEHGSADEEREARRELDRFEAWARTFFPTVTLNPE